MPSKRPKCKGCGQPRKGHVGPTGVTKCQNIVDKISELSSPHQCSICLDDARLAVVTNCVHVFCSDCLLEVWRRSSKLYAISCPYCRQRVTLLLPYFTQEENYAVDPALAGDRRRLVEEMTDYNRRNSGEPRSVMEQLRDLTMLIRHPLTRLISGRGLIEIGVTIVVGELYLVSLRSLDLIPESMDGIVLRMLVYVLVYLQLGYIMRYLEL